MTCREFLIFSIALLTIYATATLSVFVTPAVAAEINKNLSCSRGGTTLDAFIERRDSAKIRYWIDIENHDHYQIVHIIYDKGPAQGAVFLNRCLVNFFALDKSYVYELFGLDIGEVFPALKKDSF